MLKIYLVGVCFLTHFLGCDCQASCQPYDSVALHGADELCTREMENNVFYQDLLTTLQELATKPQTQQFAVQVVIWMYQYLHPCTSQEEAAVALFYDVTSSVPTLIGRRKRAFESEYDLFLYKIQHLENQTHFACVQQLININKESAARLWREAHPNFIPTTTETTVITTPPGPTRLTTTPINYTPSTTETTIITTPPGPTRPTTTPINYTPSTTETTIITTPPGPTRPTTTPINYTPSTTETTVITTPPGPTRPTTTPINYTPSTTETTVFTTPPGPTTPTTSPVIYGPISCTVCTGLQCLISPVIRECQAGWHFCSITVADTENGRDISRGCTTQETCDTQYQRRDPNCDYLEQIILPSGTRCDFCCFEDNCNKPPSLIPSGSNYPNS